MAASRDDILRFYEDFRGIPGWTRLEAIRKFLRQLFRERPLEGCTLFTSHEEFCISRYDSLPEWFERPLLSINCATDDRLTMKLRVTEQTDSVNRTRIEVANCPLELGLAEFDRMYEKFMEANA